MSAALPPGARLLDDWITAAEEERLLGTIDASPWRDDLQRRVQHYGWRYDYRARSVDASMSLGPLPSWADALARRIAAEGHDTRAPDQVIVNEYLPGQGITRHVDCIPCFGPVVLSLTLGSRCVLDLYAPVTRQHLPLPLLQRSLLVLSGASRLQWAHAIAARQSDVIEGVKTPRGRRVSLTFRTVKVKT